MILARPLFASPAASSPLWVVEAWRGIAALLVLWAHWGLPLGWPVGWMAFAFTGVDLFFVLSGFVFAPALLQSTVPSLPAFALRRVSRIYPAYLVALGLYVALAWQAGQPLLYLPEHLGMLHLQSREMAFYYNPAFWSLPAELGFYVLLPLLGWCLARQRLPAAQRHALWWGLLALALGLRLALLNAADGAGQNLAYVLLNHTPGLLVEFLLGTWAWQRWRKGVSTSASVALGVAGALGWCALAALFVHLQASAAPDWRNGQLGLLAAACFAALLLASLRLPTPNTRGWLHALGAWAGRLSYAVYLLHMAWLAPATTWAQRWGSAPATLLAVVALLGSSLLLHLLVEEPARRWGRRLAARLEARRQAPQQADLVPSAPESIKA